MSNFTQEKMDEIYKLLLKNKWNLIFKDDVSNQCKCGICDNVLINAHQTFCGCNFCHECINQYIKNGTEICPGNTDECKFENNFTNVMTNYGLNKQILKLVIKCPNQMCVHECQLIELGEHLKNCSCMLTNCPFDSIGCIKKPMKSDEINEHLRLTINEHNNLLIDFIKHVKNDIEELKRKEEYNRLEIEKLKENNYKKDKKIESLKILIKSIKAENKATEEQMEIGDRNLWKKIDEINIEINDKSNNDVIKSINDEMELLKIENRKLLQQIKSINNYIDEKLIASMRIELNEKLIKTWKSINKENEDFQLDILSRISEINKFLIMRHCGVLWWNIGEIDKIGLIWSECFYDKQNPYKMKLELKKEMNDLNLFLIINSSAFDDELEWPCKADMIIVVYSLYNYQYKQTFRETKLINRPKENSAEYSSPMKLVQSDYNFYNFSNKEQFAVKCFVNIL